MGHCGGEEGGRFGMVDNRRKAVEMFVLGIKIMGLDDRLRV
jgi:hypothetical protein